MNDRKFKVISNYHMHTNYCDGKDTLETSIKSSIGKGFKTIGFSAHAPLHFETGWTMKEESAAPYLDEARMLSRLYKDKIEIYTGMEIDYYRGDNRDIFNKYRLDYIIGSVHFVFDYNSGTHYEIDCCSKAEFERTLNACFNGDMKAFAKEYFSLLAEMLELYKPDVLGHLDIIKKNNGAAENEKGYFFNESDEWYIQYVIELLEVVKATGTFVEINTGGMTRGYLNDAYPSSWIIKECKKRNIPIIISSDAHFAEGVDKYMDFAFEKSVEAGYTHQMILHDNIWIPFPLY